MRELGQYYTSTSISDLLINNIYQNQPNIILELSVGEGALINAAIKRWSNANFITADISSEPTIVVENNSKHTHAKVNSLSLDLSSKLGIHNNTADVALCNPPYIRPVWMKAYSEILEEAGLSGALQSMKQASADILFLAQNIRLLRDYGELGIIVPDGLISGNKYKKIRENLLSNHGLKSIIQLPTNIFRKTEAQTHIITLSKNSGATNKLPLYMANNEGHLTNPVYIDQDEGIERLDYTFHKNIKKYRNNKRSMSLSDLGVEVHRGNLSWMDAKKYKIPCFHTTKFSVISDPVKWVGREVISDKLLTTYLVAEKGDILLGRVGRNITNQIAYIEEGKTLITDCVYRLRANKKYAKKIFDYLSSKEGKEQLNIRASGVCAKSLSKTDLHKIKIPL